MREPATSPIRFATPLPLEATFSAGRLTSDGGLPWVAEADVALGLCQSLAACIPEWRRGPVRHSLDQLVRQRVFQIACGYADQNDATTLRSDPLLQLVCDRLGARADSLPSLLASQPTFSRLENAVDRHTVERLATALVQLYLQQRGASGRPSRIVLDIDGTDDPVHGDQEGSGYHGYYRQHMYFPLLVFDGDTGQLITALLRPGRCHGSRFAVLVLRRLVRYIRHTWPGMPVLLRADSGFATPRLYAFCEDHQVDYTIGLIPNPPLEAVAQPLMTAATVLSEAAGHTKVRLTGECQYQAGSWPHPRRVVFKAEVLEKGPNTRFVVTSHTDDPLTVYTWYTQRGQPENWIKDLKNALAADRLSDHRFWANAFRLLLHAGAYWLLDTLRRWLAQAGYVAHHQFDTLRIRLLKVGGWVRRTTKGIHLHLASSHPGEPLWLLLAQRPGRP